MHALQGYQLNSDNRTCTGLTAAPLQWQYELMVVLKWVWSDKNLGVVTIANIITGMCSTQSLKYYYSTLQPSLSSYLILILLEVRKKWSTRMSCYECPFISRF